MDEAVPTTADHTVTVAIPGTDRSYTMRAPTYGEMGKMSLAMVAIISPTDAVVLDALREAVEAADLPADKRAEYLEYLEASIAADEAFDDALTEHGPRSDWTPEAREAMRQVIRDRRRAKTGRDRVEWAMRDAEPVLRLMRNRAEVEHREQVALIAACLGMSAEQVEALPAADAGVLRARAVALTRPSQAAEKN